jgi:HAD superfamily phosphoserine phosphatase-like hydrolase
MQDIPASNAGTVVPQKSLSPRDHDFLDAVLRLDPKLAAFDCDGTLWSGDVGEEFFRWEIERGLISEDIAKRVQARHADYRKGLVEEDTMCGEMVTLHQGLTDADLAAAAKEFISAHIAPNFFPAMLELVQQLHTRGCEIWAVSSSNQWVVREGVRHFGIPPDRVLSAEVFIENGRITDRLVRVPSGPGKPQALRDVVGRPPDAAFGNSQWDTDMLAAAKTGFAVNPSPELEQAARANGWTIYFP